MRYKLTLEPTGFSRTLPLNYQYELSSWIYKTIHFGNPEFATWLHDHGYMDGYKKFRFFTFSNLAIENCRIKGDRLEILGNSCRMDISFFTHEAAEPFIMGLFRNQEFVIGDRLSKVQFRIISIEKMQEPFWHPTMSFYTRSPLVVSVVENNARTANYLGPEHPRFNELIFKNLVKKLFATSNQNNGSINLEGVYEHPKQLKIKGTAHSKLVKIKAGTREETKVRGYLFDFTITAPVEWIKIGYYAGFGEKNSLGFGSCEVVLN